MSDHLVVVGGGISGVACARALFDNGVRARIRERGRRLSGRMSSRTLRETGTTFDGRVVDIGASYFTVSTEPFGAVIADLVQQQVVRPWTDAFHVADSTGIVGVSTGPIRYAAPGGLRSVVEALLADGAEVSLSDPVDVVRVDEHVSVDGARVEGVALCMPMPQAARVWAEAPATPITWEPVIAVTLVFEQRTWIDIDGVFVNDDPVLTWIADDGARRGDGAPVLVAHVNPVLAALHLEDPAAVAPLVIATVRRVLAIDANPEWVDVHRWTYAKPMAAHDEPYWAHDTLALGLAGDAWAGGPRVEAAWLSGHHLGRALAERLVGAR